MTKDIYIQETGTVSKQVCRLCSTTEELCNIFQAELNRREQLRLTILLATGIEIKETDVVSKMVCHHCCEIAIKLHQYRINAIINDRILMEKYGQPYKPPIINQQEILRVATRIADHHDNTPKNNGTSLTLIQLPLKDYAQSITTPLQSESSLSCNDQNSQDIADHNIQTRLTDTTIIKIPSNSTSSDSLPATDNYELPVMPSEVGISVPQNTSHLLSESTTASNYYRTSISNDNLNGNVTGYHKENDSSKINIVQKSTISIINNVTQKHRKKRGRKPKKPCFNYDFEEEVIPKKKTRSFHNKKSKKVHIKVDLPTILPNDEAQRKMVLMSSLELIPTEESFIDTIPDSSTLSSHLNVNTLVTILPSPSLISNSTYKQSSPINNRNTNRNRNRNRNKKIIRFDEKCNNNSNRQRTVKSSKLTKASEVEVICLSDDSDDDVVCIEEDVIILHTSSTTEKSTLPITNAASNIDISFKSNTICDSLNSLNENDMMNFLFNKYQNYDSKADTIPKNNITLVDENVLMVDNLVSEILKHDIQIIFESKSSLFATFQKPPLDTYESSLENWKSKKVIDVQKPYMPYHKRSVQVKSGAISNVTHKQDIYDLTQS